MPTRGRSTDGAIVFDDTIDDRGRVVVDPINKILVGGIHYFIFATSTIVDAGTYSHQGNEAPICRPTQGFLRYGRP